MNDPLATTADKHPEATALVTPEGTWTYHALEARVDELAGQLASARARPGRVIAALLPEGAPAITALHATLRTGASFAPLHPRWTDKELVDYLSVLQPDLVLCDATTEATAALVTQAPPLLTLSARSTTRALPAPELPPAPDVQGPDPETTATILATSGTSGTPRATELRLTSHLHHARATAERLDLGAGDLWLASLSTAHVGGLALVLRAATLGSTLVHHGPFAVDAFLELADDEAITHASLVPTMLHRVLDTEPTAPPTLRSVLVGGAATPADLLDRALGGGWPIALTYGLTEACSQVATAPPALVREKPGTVGPPLDGVEVQLRQPDEAGRGLLLVRGPTVMAGYRGCEEQPFEDGWLVTGDVARIDEDGHLWITGRQARRIVTGGVTVDPSEVEAVLLEHVDVAQAAVVGIPDPEWGERVSAAVVRHEDAQAGAQALQAHCREQVSGPKLPRAFIFVEELPTNANGKVDLEAVRALFEGQDS